MQKFQHLSVYLPYVHINSLTASTIDINYGSLQHTLLSDPINITSNNLANKYYLDQLVQHAQGRIFKVQMDLSLMDVIELLSDIGQKIWIDSLNNYFVLYSISDFDPVVNSLTTVELLEVVSDTQFRCKSGNSTGPNGTQTNTTVGVNTAGGTGYVVGSVPNILGPASNGGVNISTNYSNVIRSGPNVVIGEDNDTYIDATKNIIVGDGNTIAGGVKNTVVIGNNKNITESNSLYISEYAEFHSDQTILYNNINMSYSGISVGGSSGVSISSSAITINGVNITSGSTLPTDGVLFDSLMHDGESFVPNKLEEYYNVDQYTRSTSIPDYASEYPFIQRIKYDGGVGIDSDGSFILGANNKTGAPSYISGTTNLGGAFIIGGWGNGHRTNSIDAGAQSIISSVFCTVNNDEENYCLSIFNSNNCRIGTTADLGSCISIIGSSYAYIDELEPNTAIIAHDNFNGSAMTQRNVYVPAITLRDQSEYENWMFVLQGGISPLDYSATPESGKVIFSSNTMLYAIDSTGWLPFGSGGSGLPAASDGEMLYNSGGTWVHRDMAIRTGDAAEWVTIGSSLNGIAASDSAFVAGGRLISVVSSQDGVAMGGLNNSVSTSDRGVVIGGNATKLTNSSDCAAIGGSDIDITNGQYSGNFVGFQNRNSGATFSVVIGGANSNIYANSTYSSIISSQQSTIQGALNFGSILGGAFHNLSSDTYSVIIGGRSGASREGSDNIVGGYTNIMTKSRLSAAFAGSGNTMSSTTCSAIVAATGLTVTESYKLYTNSIDIQQIADMKPLSVLPSAREGRMFYSAGTGLYVCTGTTSSDWKKVSLS